MDTGPLLNGLWILQCTTPVGWCRGPLRGRYDSAIARDWPA